MVAVLEDGLHEVGEVVRAIVESSVDLPSGGVMEPSMNIMDVGLPMVGDGDAPPPPFIMIDPEANDEADDDDESAATGLVAGVIVACVLIAAFFIRGPADGVDRAQAQYLQGGRRQRDNHGRSGQRWHGQVCPLALGSLAAVR